jgi:hypothetical protein
MEESENVEEVVILKNNPRKKIPIPEMPFEKFYSQTDEDGNSIYPTIGSVLETKEWKEIYSNYYSFDKNQYDIKLDETKEEIEDYDTNRQKQEIIKCANDFYYFCAKYAKINHPLHGVINFIPYIYQKRVIECYGTHRFNILSKFRQGGLTTVSVIWALWKCLFKPGQRIMLVSKTDREAIAAGAMAKTAVEYLPSWLKPETDKFNEHEKQFKETDSVLWSYTAEAARGKSITVLIIDEAAFIPDMHRHWKSLYPVVSTGGSCQVISTVNGLGNWYEEWYHDAEAGKNPFNVIELDYWEHPLYNDPKWIKDTREILGDKGWAQEIERSFIGSGDTWIKPHIITALVSETKDNNPLRMKFEQWKNKNSEKRYNFDEGALWIWKEPYEGHEYIISADCAEGIGETGDNSCFQILDKSTLEQVAEFYSNTVPPHIFAQILNQIGIFYKEGEIVIENAGIGAAVLNILQHELQYDNLFYEGNSQKSAGLKTTKGTKPQILQALQQRLMNKTLKVNSYRFVFELNTFIFNPNTKKPEARRGQHDDAIMALAIALYVRDLSNRNLPAGAAATEESMNIFRSNVYQEIRNEIINSDDLEFFTENDDEESEDNSFYTNLALDNQDVIRRYKRERSKILQEFGW